MNKRYVNIVTVLLLAACCILLQACKDDEDEFGRTRLFRPVLSKDLSAITNKVVVNMGKMKGATKYTIDISRDTFKTIDATIDTDTNYVVFENLLWNQLYQVQALAHADDPAFDSKKSFLGVVTTQKYPSILKAPGASDATDVAVRVSWSTAGAAVTSIKVFKKSDNSLVKEVALTDQDRTKQEIAVNGLNPSTRYVIYLYSAEAIRGWEDYTTKTPSFSGGNIIDLRSFIGKPGILMDTLPDIASGSVVVLKRGQVYTVSTSYAFDKSVTIVSGLDLGGEIPVIRLTSNFTFAANSTIDSLVFREVQLKGSRAAGTSYDNDYIINANVVATVGKIRLDGCRIGRLRGVVRVQMAASTGAKIADYIVNNCVVDSIREYGIATASGVSAIANIRITNSTFYKMRRFIVHSVAGNNSISVKNTTFNELPAGGPAGAGTNYVIDMNAANSVNPVVVDNCNFGKTWNEGAGTDVRGIRVGSGTTVTLNLCYATSDFVNTATPLNGVVYSTSSSTDVYEAPSAGNFKIKLSSFIGKGSGDPRWR